MLSIALIIKELEKENKLAQKIKDRESYVAAGEVGVNLVFSIMLRTGSSTIVSKISNQRVAEIAEGLKRIAHNKPIRENASKLTKSTYTIEKQIKGNFDESKIVSIAYSMVSNNEKRMILKDKLLTATKQQIVGKGVGMATTDLAYVSLDYNKANDYFKVIENELPGRIGDFSDGFLTVYNQNIRDIIKYNQTLISSKSQLHP